MAGLLAMLSAALLLCSLSLSSVTYAFDAHRPAQRAPSAQAQLETFCTRFGKACSASCLDAGIPGNSTTFCEAASGDFYDFGCMCSDKSVITSAALKYATGFTKVKSKTKTIVKTDVVEEATRTRKLISSVTSTSTIFATTEVISTSTKTSYIYKPSSAPDADRIARQTFGDAFAASCRSVCSTDKSTVNVSTAALQSIGVQNDRYKLICTCASGDNLTVDALVGVGSSNVKTLTTSTRTIRTSSTTYRTVTRVLTEVSTAAVSTETVVATKTSTLVAAGPTESITAKKLSGRVRVDRTDRVPENDMVGYISTRIGRGGFDGGPYAVVDYNPQKAAHVTFKLEPSGKHNAYALEWRQDNGTVFHLNEVQEPDGSEELGSPPSCDTNSSLKWYKNLFAYGPQNSSVSPYAMESYVFSLGESSLNIVNPDRKIQVPISLLHVTSSGTPYVPYTTLAFGVIFVKNLPIRDNNCDGYASIDVTLVFEPDL